VADSAGIVPVMGDDDLGPEGFGTRGIPSAKKGYDKRVVDTLVAEAVERWAELKRRFDALQSEVDRAGGLEHLTRDMKAVGEEVARILEVAKEAADGMRSRARADGDAITTAAEIRAAELTRGGEEDAFQARHDAWETGTELLGLVRETSSAIIAEAEDDALLIRAEAERESHRRLAVTRKEQDDMIRIARYELDRHIAMARDLASEILTTANTEEVSLTPTPGQDDRRRELLADIERLRATRGIEEVSVLPADPIPARPREDSFYRDFDSGMTDLSESLAAEVEQLGGTRGARPAAAAKVAAAERRSTRTGADDVGTLFEALRTTAEVEVVVDRVAPDPIGFHERIVIPALNMGVRDLKRRIVDRRRGTGALRTAVAGGPHHSRAGHSRTRSGGAAGLDRRPRGGAGPGRSGGRRSGRQRPRAAAHGNDVPGAHLAAAHRGRRRRGHRGDCGAHEQGVPGVAHRPVRALGSSRRRRRLPRRTAGGPRRRRLLGSARRVGGDPVRRLPGRHRGRLGPRRGPPRRHSPSPSPPRLRLHDCAGLGLPVPGYPLPEGVRWARPVSGNR
jgi:hypothetical protein